MHTSIFDFESDNTGRIKLSTSSRLDPAYARASLETSTVKTALQKTLQ